MPASRTSAPDPEDMADVMHQPTAHDPPDMLSWSDPYPDMDTYLAPWPDQPGSDHSLAQPRLEIGGSWRSHDSMQNVHAMQFQQGSQSVSFPGQQHVSQQSRAYDYLARSTQSSSAPSLTAYQTTRYHDPMELTPSASQSVRSSYSSVNRQHGDSLTPTGLDDIQHQSRQSSQTRNQVRTTSLQIPQPRSRGSRSNSTTSIQLQDEDRLLLHLKEEESLSWKDIAYRFQTDAGATYQIPALQMRYKRLKEKMRVWSDSDLEALRQAREYWEVKKWDIISNKMADFGASEKFSAEACKRKMNELDSAAMGSATSPGLEVITQHSPSVRAGGSAPGGSASSIGSSSQIPQSWMTQQW
ncbi:hypothetical protein FH972_024336 [Carpinus fangiana]|uniref:Myb-like domain-containing protein n=1 Tax=Carpinus fangiana TaxID=176857 RepID=A0A5N6KXS2_9ROSI|nr:hypothetical protein FH972_024336 [Carpinus fangiana]